MDKPRLGLRSLATAGGMSLRERRGNLIASAPDCFGTTVSRNDRGECHAERSKELRFVIWILAFVI